MRAAGEVRLDVALPGEVSPPRCLPERFARRGLALERFFPLHEFQGALATLMAYLVTPFLGACLPPFRYCLPHRWGVAKPPVATMLVGRSARYRAVCVAYP